MNNIEHKYRELIQPDNFIELFKDMDEFKDWCYLGTIEDLNDTLNAFQEYELYEHCGVIKDVILELEVAKEKFTKDFKSHNETYLNRHI